MEFLVGAVLGALTTVALVYFRVMILPVRSTEE